ncbi:type II secretion system protein [uncultured Desulfuromonas sp.]|uniref:type II secretion system protein n=1 Tax=uncultured Desulfuromonas sp. TaxID=181013 RepID=UPI002AAB0907|nr:type II secretion system protein [uncultured Desulfuromonas sp.]
MNKMLLPLMSSLRSPRQKGRFSAGFTLVELIVVILIVSILATLGGMFISHPIEGYVDLRRRAELVGQAEMALRRMQRDIRAALPNSVRLYTDTDGNGIELLHVVDGGRYRRNMGTSGGDILDFTQADNKFDVLGGLRHAVDGRSYGVVIYNLAATGIVGNAYAGDNRSPGVYNADSTISLDNPTVFPFDSPSQRFFLVDQAVVYHVANGILWRHAGYAIDNVADTPGGGVVVAQHVQSVAFQYAPGTPSRAGLVTITLTLQDGGEQVRLLHQVHVDNAP